MWSRERLHGRDAAAAKARARFGAVLAGVAIFYAGWAFGWPWWVAGAALGVVHVVIARRAAPRAILALWHLVAVPAAIATLLAATPYDAWFLVAPVLLALWLTARVPERLLVGGQPLAAHAAGLIAGALTLFVCAWLPVKTLDRKVGPAEYMHVTLLDLSVRFRDDLNISFYVYEEPLRWTVVDFEIPRPMSKRAVLDKLAADTRLEFDLRYCGNGASILWGGFPMAVELRARRELR